MKLLLAIVNKDDANYVNTGLNKSGYMVTKIASTGGFLKNGNTTFMIGVQDEEVDNVLEIISHFSKKRTVQMPTDTFYDPTNVLAMPQKVTVGGATVFILNVERFEHI